MITCVNCGTANDPSRKFCGECGARLAIACPACGTPNAPGTKFCGECGTALTDVTAAAAQASASAATAAGIDRSQTDGAPVAERRLVSVLFADLVGFTSMSASQDAEDVRELQSRYFEAAREVVARHGGLIEKFIGDAVMAVWGTPTAHEDDAERAVRTALQLVEAVAGLEIGGQPLQARAGVLTGEAAVTIGAEGQGMVTGDLVNTASRLQSAAAPGTVLVGEATYRAASGSIAFEEAGEQQLKGKDEPVRAWRATAVVARRRGEGRSASLEPPFVGRHEELRTLKDQFHATGREGKPRLVTLVGQAGIGKSRLAWELEKYLDGLVDNVLWHEGRSPAYGEGISYWALAEMVRSRARIAESDDPQQGRQRLAEMLAQQIPDETERRWIEPRLTGLLGLDELPSESREALFAAWRRFFERLAEQGTVLLVFWDLQWADQGLLDFVEHLLTWSRTSPLFVVAEARPELFDRRPGWGVTVRASTSVHLEPLSEEDMRTLLAGLVPGLPQAAANAIVQRAEGVPLYAVETLRMLVDRGVLRRAEDESAYELVADLPDLDVPETLQALIAARLDALDPVDRALLTDAAVVGLSFAQPVLRALSGLETDALVARLDGLVRHQLLVLDVDPLSPERGQYRFIQGVVREVAYQSLAKRERRTKHLAAARYFEALGEEELSGVLASHYLAAYRATPAGPEADALAAQARVALRAAADRAAALHAQVGALGYLEQALEVTEEPRDRAALHEQAARAATAADRPSAADVHARRAEEIFAEAGDRLGVLRMRTLRAWIRLHQHGDREAIAIMRPALAEVGDLPASSEIARAEALLARALMVAGEPEALDWADRALANASVLTEEDVVEALINKASALMSMGRAAEGEVIMRGAIEVADRRELPPSSLRARNNLTVVLDTRDLEETRRVAQEVFQIAERYANRSWALQALGVESNLAIDMGEWDAWQEHWNEYLADASEFYRIWYEANDALIRAYRGGGVDALRLTEEAESAQSMQESAQAQGWLAWHKVEILISLGRREEAFEAARVGFQGGDQGIYAMTFGAFAAAAMGDTEKLAEARQAMDALPRDLPRYLAVRQIADCLASLLVERWDHARETYVAAHRSLHDIGDRLLDARLGLAVSQLARDAFPEAAEAGREAETFFTERGAESFVLTYRAKAFTPTAGSAALPEAESAPLRTESPAT